MTATRSTSSCSTRRTASRPARPRSSTTAPASSARATIAATRGPASPHDLGHRRRLDARRRTRRRSTRRCGSCSASCPTCRTCPSCPGAGRAPNITGRTLGLVAELGADLQPAGWRLTDASGIDHRRAAALLAQDLDALEELPQGYAGAVQDPGRGAVDAGRDRREAARRQGAGRPRCAPRARPGAGRGVARPRRRRAAPGAGRDRLVVQVDEPALPAVLGGAGADGVRLRPAPHGAPAGGVRALGWVFAAIAEPGRQPWVHCLRGRRAARRCCAARAPAGSRSTSTLLTAAAYDAWRGAGGGETVRARRRTRPSPRRPADGHRGDRAGAPLARHARPGPRGGRRAAGRHARPAGWRARHPGWARSALAVLTKAAGHLTGWWRCGVSGIVLLFGALLLAGCGEKTGIDDGAAGGDVPITQRAIAAVTLEHAPSRDHAPGRPRVHRPGGPTKDRSAPTSAIAGDGESNGGPAAGLPPAGRGAAGSRAKRRRSTPTAGRDPGTSTVAGSRSAGTEEEPEEDVQLVAHHHPATG